MSAVASSLEIAAGRCADPTPEIYARLFAQHPELESEFHMDTDGGVRGGMLSQAFDVLLDLADGDGTFATAILMTERANHEGYGIPPRTFFIFLATIRDWVHHVLSGEWTADMDRDWRAILQKAQAICGISED
ncbi:MAG: globin [Pseudomonadota bacterium]